MSANSNPPTGFARYLPRIGSPGYHLLLASVAIFILGPLGGISAAFMNFSIGFFIGGQVLAGILGSAVTLPYGPDGKHGANYIQTMAASVAGMCGMGVLMQAMVWLGLPEPALWKLVLFYLCIGMYGVGLGMLYTPILVDRMQLVFPSGFAVANILRALTDKNLLKRSVAKLGGGMLFGSAGGLLASKVAAVKIVTDTGKVLSMSVQAINISPSTFGAGAICGARIAIPALVVGILGYDFTHWLEVNDWIEVGAPFRKIGFIISLGTILGAAIVDITLIMIQAVKRYRQTHTMAEQPAEDWKRVNMRNLVLWILFWGVGTVVIGHHVMGQPVLFLTVAVLLCFLFVLVNGISLGIS
ncbi:MAG: peptide transporter, partial [Verrucomicrobia bacterium]